MTRRGRLSGMFCLCLLAVIVHASAAGQTRPASAQPNVTILTPPLAMPGLNRHRTIRLYLPPGYAKSGRRYPVLYMHDGQNLFDAATSYAGEWGVDESLNRLARKGKLEIIVVGIDHGGEKRIAEMMPWDHPKHGKAEGRAYLEFVVRKVKPYIDRHYRTRPGREHTAIMGSSLGALISHYALFEYPHVFSKAGLFSASYWISEEIYTMTASRPLPHDTRIYFAAGSREGSDTASNVKRMHALAVRQSLPARNALLNIVPEGEHNEAAWRALFPFAVEWLFARGGN